MLRKYFLPVEVFSTVDIIVSEETFVVQGHVTLMTANTVHVPGAIQNSQQKSLKNISVSFHLFFIFIFHLSTMGLPQP